MYISEICEIENYRNLSGQRIVFDNSINFLIGENNIGKTNILELLNIFFSIGKFSESDYYDISQPIRVKVKIKYGDEAIGFFEDNFDIDNSGSITLLAEQENYEGRISYYHDTPNMTNIGMNIIRKINILYYYAQRMPSKEVDFRKNSGSGKILNYLIEKSLERTGLNEPDLLNRGQINTVVNEINVSLNNIDAIVGDGIKAYLDPRMDKVVSRILMLGDDSERELSTLGEGIQYAFNILLQIIDIIHSVKISRTQEDFNDRLLVNNGQKYFPLFLLLDEPEIHQHPYRQRNLIKKINDIMTNKISSFTELLNDLFQIDGLVGQIIVATHSPNILLEDYHQFIRVYKDNYSIRIVSGSALLFDDKLYKHMLHNYLYLKEAMFSKKIVFVEGDTENGAIPVFATREGFDLDEHGVGVVKLDGADSVKPCMKLYNQFGIDAVAIIDRDKESSYSGEQNVYFTTQLDYESDVYDNFLLSDYLQCCKELKMLRNFIPVLEEKGIVIEPSVFLENPELNIVPENIQEEIMIEQRNQQLIALKRQKNASKGAILAEYVTTIPDAFMEIIRILKGIDD